MRIDADARDDNGGMPPPPVHRRIAADAHRVPEPFRSFAVRSEEPRHAYDARAPYAQVHVVRAPTFDAASLARLAAEGDARVSIGAFSDVDYATTTLAELSAAAPALGDLAGALAAALQQTGVLGDDLAAYRRSVETRVDFLASRGAGFHNDVGRHWSGCLFWVLTLAATDVEFVMPHAGVRLPLCAGELVVFDQTMAHGVCRPADGGRVEERSFDGSDASRQVFLTGELQIPDAQWAALGAPWLPVEAHERRGALDLMVAEFDECSGAIKRLRAMRDGMKRSTCHVDESSA
jgi:hypothetical protein